MIDIEKVLCALVACDGSDLHLKVGSVPLARIDGVLGPLLTDEWPVLEPADTEAAVKALLKGTGRYPDFDAEHEIDLSHDIPGVARFRINAFCQRGYISIVARAIPHRIRTIEELMLPPVITELAEETRGIILATGTTGSGKSTTLAAMIDHINRTRAAHIVTIEDPIEFVHEDHLSMISQREVGLDTASFKRALRRVLRQDPDVILIGEMRDEETVATAISAAETGHLVFSTIHTVDAAESINRMLDFFPTHQHKQVRSMLAGTLKGVVSQRLLPAAVGGRIAACEVLRMTGRVRDVIRDPTQTTDLSEVIAEGSYYGMQTFDQALLAHVLAGRVRVDDALAAASSPHDFKLMLDAEGDAAPQEKTAKPKPTPVRSSEREPEREPAPPLALVS
ncbi:MAG: PilT/PilU family type 4a pilus ATPase [Solirubrobacteraceae bacterium]